MNASKLKKQHDDLCTILSKIIELWDKKDGHLMTNYSSSVNKVFCNARALLNECNSARVVRNRGPEKGFKIKCRDGSLSPETYGSRKGAQAMIDGTFGSAGGIS